MPKYVRADAHATVAVVGHAKFDKICVLTH